MRIKSIVTRQIVTLTKNPDPTHLPDMRLSIEVVGKEKDLNNVIATVTATINGVKP